MSTALFKNHDSGALHRGGKDEIPTGGQLLNIGVLLERNGSASAGRTALRFGDVSLTFGELDGRVNALANGLLDLGVKKGDRVAIVQNNCHQLLESMLACFRTGFAAVPINAKLTGDEMRYIIDNSDASAAVVGDEFAEVATAVSVERPGTHLVSLAGSVPGSTSYEKIVTTYAADRPRTEAGLDDLAWLFYTSGTTGRPKGAMLTQRSLMVMTMNFLAEIFPIGPEDSALHAAPLTHGSGLYAIPAIARGASTTIIKSASFNPELLFATVQEERTSVLPFLTPTMIKLLLLSPRIGDYDLASLKRIAYAGGPMYVEDMKEAVKRFGKILVQCYGLGEAPMTITYLSAENHHANPTTEQATRMLSAGVARMDVEVGVVDGEDRPLSHGEMGEIVCRGDVVMQGYWRNPEATARTLKGGWLHTGDVGYLDEFGYLYIMDRIKDMVDSGGAKVYPREVEEVLLKHPAVQEACVLGVPDRVWGESVKAVIVLRPGARASETEIIEFCKGKIAGYKKPRSVDFVEAIPKNAYGKVLKRELRDRYWAGMQRRV